MISRSSSREHGDIVLHWSCRRRREAEAMRVASRHAERQLSNYRLRDCCASTIMAMPDSPSDCVAGFYPDCRATWINRLSRIRSREWYPSGCYPCGAHKRRSSSAPLIRAGSIILPDHPHAVQQNESPAGPAPIMGSTPSISRATCGSGPTGSKAATWPTVWIVT
jgi:hypothetical protein